MSDLADLILLVVIWAPMAALAVRAWRKQGRP